MDFELRLLLLVLLEVRWVKLLLLDKSAKLFKGDHSLWFPLCKASQDKWLPQDLLLVLIHDLLES